MAKTITLIAKLKGAAKARKGLKGIDGALGSMVQTAFTVGTAMKALEFVKLSGQSEALARGFNNLSKSSGFSAQALNKLRSATDGTMNSMDLMKQANNAMLLGIAESEDQMADMFDVAQRLASALGQDTAFGIESLVTGLGRQSKLMLDNLGIMVDATSANENYAEVLDKTVSELTDAERKQAFVNEAMKVANALVKNLGDEHLTTADKIKQAQTAMDDLKVQIGVLLTPVIENAAKAAGILAKKLRLAIDPESLRMDELRTEIARLQAHLIKMANDPSFLDKLKNMLGGDAILMERLRLYEDQLKKLQETLSTTGNVIVSDFLKPPADALEQQINLAQQLQSALSLAFNPKMKGGDKTKQIAIQMLSIMEGVVVAAGAVSTSLSSMFTGPFGWARIIAALVALEGAKALVRDSMVEAATGFDGVVTQPTLFMTGEGNKAERVSVTPLQGPNINGPQGGGGIHLHFGAVTNEDYVKDFIVPEIQKAQRLNLA